MIRDNQDEPEATKEQGVQPPKAADASDAGERPPSAPEPTGQRREERAPEPPGQHREPRTPEPADTVRADAAAP
ncbi:hypothetical protein E5Z02_31135, partial [Streptomyces rhizosphaericola]